MDVDDPPPRKRQRQELQVNASKEPRLFVPFRALGLITNHVPFVLQVRSQLDLVSFHAILGEIILEGKPSHRMYWSPRPSTLF